jgi:hypothetical protein
MCFAPTYVLLLALTKAFSVALCWVVKAACCHFDCLAKGSFGCLQFSLRSCKQACLSFPDEA